MSLLQEIFIPDIDGSTDVEVIEILIQVGDIVDLDQSLIMLETDKATMEVPSPYRGKVTRLHIAEGDRVSEGSIILELESTPVEDTISPKKNEIPEASKSSVEQPKMIDKTIPNSSSDRSFNIHEPIKVDEAVESSSFDKENIVYASPSIRKIANELEINLFKVRGTGNKNRITKADVYSFVKSLIKKESEHSDNNTTSLSPFSDMLAWPNIDFAKFGPIRRQPLTRVQKISGANLHRNWVSIPHVTNHEDADITDLEAFRVQLNQQNENLGMKVTMVALLIKAMVAALKKFPTFNASLDQDEIVLKDYFHVGFAADTPNGLMVPVVRDADKKGIFDITKEVSELASKARAGKLTVADMSGGCISISSLGGIGGTYFTPIINAPEIAIMGVGRARTELKWNGKEAEPRLILPMSLSWDHRAVDGAQAGRFNAYLAKVLADIRLVML